tara:strand:- start:3201 stop:3776 length:576 start_codon:yes stop_codon:yes gene_type:complete
MAMVYSIVAGRKIEVPDRPKAVAASAASPADRAMAMQLATYLVEAEARIKALTDSLAAETAKAKTLGQECGRHESECDAAETKAADALAEVSKLRIAMAKAEGDAKAAMAKQQATIETEKALRVAAEKRVRDMAEEHKKMPMPAATIDMAQITAAIRAAMPENKPSKPQFSVDVSERDANGRISKFNLKAK